MGRTCTVMKPGSIDRHHNVPGTRLAEANAKRVAMKRQQMDQVPYWLDRHRRRKVRDAFREVCLTTGTVSPKELVSFAGIAAESTTRPEKPRNRLIPRGRSFYNLPLGCIGGAGGFAQCHIVFTAKLCWRRIRRQSSGV